MRVVLTSTLPEPAALNNNKKEPTNSKMRPRLSWFATEKGRKFMFGATCVTGAGIMTANFVPQTFLLEKYQDIMQKYRNGEGEKLPQKVLTRAEEMLDKLNIPEKERNLIKFFTVCGFDPFFAGSTATIQGAYVGIPSNFGYDKIIDVEKNMITVNGQPLQWGSKAGQDLINAVLLSDNAQKFAIGTQIHQARSVHIYTNTITAGICFVGAYSFAHSFNKRLNAFAKPLIFRSILYTIIGSFMMGTWALLKDITTTGLENTADREVAKLSPELAKGGLEFYEQVLSRNIALRELMGSDGEKQFTASGNPEVLIRTRHVPITIRRDNLKKIINSFKIKENQSSD
ncbi:hypothetical protein B566_EDAN001266 [Ephemera danica]|nr:hypothetical protein B566_EDAN001266 [Ephemera danica]